MDKNRVADILEEIALLLEFRGESPFKCRAYENAARTVRSLDRDVRDLVSEGRLRDLKGIGEALSGKIATLVTTGRLPYHEDLRRALPPAARDILKIPGLGPRKAGFLIEKLQISSLGELEYACHENRLLDLPGFGSKTQERILKGIERVKQYRGQILLGDALPMGEELVRALASMRDVQRAACAGSVRRRRETVKDVNLVAACGSPPSVAAAFARLPSVKAIALQEETRVSAFLEGEVPVDLRIVPDDDYACALLHFTGSPEHLAALQGRGRAMGLELSPRGLHRGSDRLATPDEEAIYHALGLAPVPPELREGQGEVEAAAAGALPVLVQQSDLRGILHVHSTWSDGRMSIEGLVERCAALEYEYVGITDHSQTARYARGLTPESLEQQQTQIDEAQSRHPGIRVLKGSEVDILPDGSLDYPEEVLATLDFVVASVHSSFGLPEEEQTRRIVRALRHPRTTILGHPTGRLLLARDPYAVDLEEVLGTAAREGVYVELNAHPRRLDLDTAACRLGRALGARFAIDPDAHDEAGLTDIRFGVGVARRAGLGPAEILNAAPAGRLDQALRRTR